MENPFQKSLPAQEVTLEDVTRFGEFLLNGRKGKAPAQIATQLGVQSSHVLKWEEGETFPGEDKLQMIAHAYGVALDELKKVFDISKAARMLERQARRPARKIIPKGDQDTEVFWGASGASSRSSRTPRRR